MKLELRIYSCVLAILGIIALFQPIIISPIWGGLLISSAVLAFLIPRRGMFLLFAILLMIIGGIYMVGVIPTGKTFYIYYGGFYFMICAAMAIRMDKYKKEKKLK